MTVRKPVANKQQEVTDDLFWFVTTPPLEVICLSLNIDRLPTFLTGTFTSNDRENIVTPANKSRNEKEYQYRLIGTERTKSKDKIR